MKNEVIFHSFVCKRLPEGTRATRCQTEHGKLINPQAMGAFLLGRLLPERFFRVANTSSYSYLSP